MRSMLIVALLVFVINAPYGFAEGIHEVRWATPEWDKYTNQDGSGFYNELMSRIFESRHIRIVREYVPWKRALQMTQKGATDMTGVDDPNQTYLQSTYPIFQSIESVWFKKCTIQKWNGVESLKGRKGVWYLGYLDSTPEEFLPFFQGRGVRTRMQAVSLVLFERADYYFDNKDQMEFTIQSADNSFNRNEYRMETAYIAKKNWQFYSSGRGEKIREIFDQGFKELYCSGGKRSRGIFSIPPSS